MSPDRYRVTRISRIPAHPLHITFTTAKQTRSWEPADAPVEPGSPQDVDPSIAEAITSDSSLAPHFRVEPIAPSEPDAVADADRDDQEA